MQLQQIHDAIHSFHFMHKGGVFEGSEKKNCKTKRKKKFQGYEVT